MESKEKIKEIIFNFCCCNHYHEPECLSYKYNFAQKHDKNQGVNQCFCKDQLEPNYHHKDCKYYNDFIIYLNRKSIDKNKLNIIEEKNINKICCCDLNIGHNDIEK